MYKLNSLSHAPLVESADKIMKLLLKDYTIKEVETNSVDAVIYSIFLSANGKFEALETILGLCQPISGTNRKASISIRSDGTILLKFFGVNNGKDIWLCIQRISENGFEGFLA
jgi:hypothetical protein